MYDYVIIFGLKNVKKYFVKKTKYAILTLFVILYFYYNNIL